MPATHEVTHAIHTYGDADQPINIHDDTRPSSFSACKRRRNHAEANRRLTVSHSVTLSGR